MKVVGGVLLMLLGAALALYCGMSTRLFYASNDEDTWWKVAGAVGALEGLSAVAVGLWLLMRGIVGRTRSVPSVGIEVPRKDLASENFFQGGT